jgi:hypothetical protein
MKQRQRGHGHGSVSIGERRPEANALNAESPAGKAGLSTIRRDALAILAVLAALTLLPALAGTVLLLLLLLARLLAAALLLLLAGALALLVLLLTLLLVLLLVHCRLSTVSAKTCFAAPRPARIANAARVSLVWR